jgi:hypothetical protein
MQDNMRHVFAFLQVIVIVTWINKLQNRTNTKSEERRAEPNCDFMLVNYKVRSNHSYSNCEEGRRKLIKVIRRPAGSEKTEKLHTLKMLRLELSVLLQLLIT